MTPEKTKKAFRECGEMLLKRFEEEEQIGVVKSQRFPADTTPLANDDVLSHCLWMCEEGQLLVDQGRIEKAMRWLGFVQGVMWATLDICIDDMKHINMPEPEGSLHCKDCDRTFATREDFEVHERMKPR